MQTAAATAPAVKAVTWFNVDVTTWTVTGGCDVVRDRGVVNQNLWDVYPEMESVCREHHLAAHREGHTEFLCNLRDRVFFVRSERDGPREVRVTNVDVEALMFTLRRLDAARAVPSAAPTLRRV